MVFFVAVLAVSSFVFAEPEVNYTSGRKKPLVRPESFDSAQGMPVEEQTEEPLSETGLAPMEPVPVALPEEPSSIQPLPEPAEEPIAETPAPSSVETAPPVPELVPPAPLPETVWMDDDLPEGTQTEGTWLWDENEKAGGSRSHGHPAGKGLQSHALSFSKPILLTSRDMVSQQVWLDPRDPPQGIALRFKTAAGEEVGVYWEGEEEVFTPAEYEELWYYGSLPEMGKWETLQILVEDLGLEEEQVLGIKFVTYGGRVLWDKASLTQAPDIEGTETPSAEPIQLRPDTTR